MDPIIQFTFHLLYFILSSIALFIIAKMWLFLKIKLYFLKLGLFSGAIQESGSAIDIWAVDSNPYRPIEPLSYTLNIKSTELPDICEELTYEWTAEEVTQTFYKNFSEGVNIYFSNCLLILFHSLIYFIRKILNL